MLRPDFPTLHAGWRIEREQDLIARTGIGMTERQVYDHVHPFLPISYLCYEKVTPDMRISINEDHRFYDITSLNKEG
jgi:pantothenate kinase-related protein Tda10